MNRLRAEILEEELEKELIVEEKPPVGKIPDNFFTLFFQKGVVSTEAATRMLPFIFFVAFLAMVYIANRHMAENTMREIDKLSKQVKELSWDYKTTKAELAFKSTLTEVEKRTDTLGLKTSVEPPQKIMVTTDEH
ncbi:FtsL-like putative cell division protein [Mucilaginibacter sp.]|uniref:FtsL-like putative cell division protein n=1 Tax=Mucilaginibacter sp. TaxID=1882438 RepID=UPI003B0090DF